MVARFGEDGNEPSVWIKSQEFLDYLSLLLLFRRDGWLVISCYLWFLV
jgi:hypothetical protein